MKKKYIPGYHAELSNTQLCVHLVSWEAFLLSTGYRCWEILGSKLQPVIRHWQRYAGLAVNGEPSSRVFVKLHPHNSYRDIWLSISPKIRNCLVSLHSFRDSSLLKVTLSFENKEILVFIGLSSCHVYEPENHLWTEIRF